MDNDLISRSALIRFIDVGHLRHPTELCYSELGVANLIKNAPAVDAVPVVHGRWYLLDECSNEGVYCSVCHKKVYRKDYANQKVKSDYCPNCGADMREREEK